MGASKKMCTFILKIENGAKSDRIKLMKVSLQISEAKFLSTNTGSIKASTQKYFLEKKINIV